MLVPCLYHCQHMGYLTFHQYGGRRNSMCSLGIDQHRNCLHSGDIELEGSYMGPISMLLVPIGAIVEAGPRHMANAPTVQASPR
jgi:hypothetical protein